MMAWYKAGVRLERHVIMAAGAVGANIGHAEWSVMLRDLIAATGKRDRVGCWVDASSSHSVHKRLRWCEQIEKGKALKMDVGGMGIVISDTGVACRTHALGDHMVVKGCSLGDGGVWLSVEAAAFGFWLEIHVPMQAHKGGGYAGV